MLSLAIRRGEPAAIRYSRGSLMQMVSSQPVEVGAWETLLPLSGCTVIATGSMVEAALPAAKQAGAGLVNARTIKPMDYELLEEIRRTAERVVVVEECADCLGKAVAAELDGIRVTRMNVPDRIISHATVAEQRAECGLTTADIARAIGEDIG